MPTALPVAADNVSPRQLPRVCFFPQCSLMMLQMNYAIVYLAGILFIALLYWFVRGKRFYTGPLIEAEIADAESFDRSSEEEGEKKLDRAPNSVIA